MGFLTSQSTGKDIDPFSWLWLWLCAATTYCPVVFYGVHEVPFTLAFCFAYIPRCCVMSFRYIQQATGFVAFSFVCQSGVVVCYSLFLLS